MHKALIIVTSEIFTTTVLNTFVIVYTAEHWIQS